MEDSGRQSSHFFSASQVRSIHGDARDAVPAGVALNEHETMFPRVFIKLGSSSSRLLKGLRELSPRHHTEISGSANGARVVCSSSFSLLFSRLTQESPASHSSREGHGR